MLPRRTFAAFLLAILTSAIASPSHAYTLPPGYIYDLAAITSDGPISASFTYYSTSFTASSATTTVSFIPQGRYLTLDDLSVSLMSGGPNLLADPGFESAQLYSGEPAGWTTIAQPSAIYGPAFDVADQTPYDGAQDLFVFGDTGGLTGIAQTLETTAGSNYTVGLYLGLTGYTPAFPSNFDSGDDVTVYAQGGLPAGVGLVPEPATWSLMLVGIGGLGGVLRVRRTCSRRAVGVAAD